MNDMGQDSALVGIGNFSHEKGHYSRSVNHHFDDPELAAVSRNCSVFLAPGRHCLCALRRARFAEQLLRRHLPLGGAGEPGFEPIRFISHGGARSEFAAVGRERRGAGRTRQTLELAAVVGDVEHAFTVAFGLITGCAKRIMSAGNGALFLLGRCGLPIWPRQGPASMKRAGKR